MSNPRALSEEIKILVKLLFCWYFKPQGGSNDMISSSKCPLPLLLLFKTSPAFIGLKWQKEKIYFRFTWKYSEALYPWHKWFAHLCNNVSFQSWETKQWLDAWARPSWNMTVEWGGATLTDSCWKGPCKCHCFYKALNCIHLIPFHKIFLPIQAGNHTGISVIH